LLRLFDGLDRSRFEPFSIVPERSPLATAAILARLRCYAIYHGINILHANAPYTYRLASIGVGSNNRPARICHIHHQNLSSQVLKWLLKRKPNLVLTPTKFVRDRVCEWLDIKDASFVHVVGNPVDVKWFSHPLASEEVRLRVGMDLAGPHVTIIGALSPHKGHDCFLRMASIILKSIPAATFHVIGSAQTGDKEYAARLRWLVHELGIEKSVRFRGVFPMSRRGIFYAQATCLCYQQRSKDSVLRLPRLRLAAYR